MKLKRILSGLIGFPIVALIFIYGNTYIIDAFVCIISIIAMYEYLKCLSVDYKPVKWIAYIPCLIIPFLHVIPKEYLLMAFTVLLSLVVMLLFMKVIASNMKTSISDIAVTLFGIIYITFFFSFHINVIWNGKRKIFNLVYTNFSMGNRYLCISCWNEIWKT